jgi:hypothetical protein
VNADDTGSGSGNQGLARRWYERGGYIWLLTALWLAAVLPRELRIAAENSPCMDADWHLRRGLLSWNGNPEGLMVQRNDPPLGQILLSLPMAVLGCSDLGAPIDRRHWTPGADVPGDHSASAEVARRQRLWRHEVLLGHRLSPEALVAWITGWKTLLMLPVVGVLLFWVRDLAGYRAVLPMWLVLAGEPSWIAHVGAIALDSLGAGSGLVATYALWKWLHGPDQNRRRGALAGCLLAMALSIKHTNIVLVIPAVALGFYKGARSRRRAQSGSPSVTAGLDVGRGLGAAAAFAIWLWACLWVFDGLNVSRPADELLAAREWAAIFSFPLPAGRYIGCVLSAIQTGRQGYISYVSGLVLPSGAWWVIPVTLWNKLPWGLLALLATSVLIVLGRWRRVRWEEWLMCGVALLAVGLVMKGGMYHGIRHLLMPLMLVLMVSIAVLSRSRHGANVALVLALAGALEGARAHPFELSFMNRVHDKPWMVLGDSNMDWGQQGVAIRKWVASLPYPRPVIWAAVRGESTLPSVRWWMGHEVRPLDVRKTPPSSGWVILPPSYESGQADVYDRFARLRPTKPMAVIANSMGVYELDGPKPRTQSATSRPAQPAILH